MTRPMYIFRISPADPCLIEWRRNQRGAEWLYWCRRQTAEEARAALADIERAGLVIERHPNDARRAPRGTRSCDAGGGK